MRAALALDAALVVLAAAAANVRLPPDFVEGGYANGLYAHLNMLLVPLANLVPFALCDLVFGLILLALAAGWVRGLRRGSGSRLARVLRLLAHALGLAAAFVLAFEVLWAWNYQRAPLSARFAYEPARVNDAAVDALAARIVRILNEDVAAAHERAQTETPAEMRAQLHRDWAPILARAGDRWPVVVTVPKHTIVDVLYEMAGVGGQYMPFTFETLLNASFLPYEVPRALAHEWTHVGGFGDEGDANYVGTIACLRSPDPLIRYSGAFWTYPELPQRDRDRFPLSAAVKADMAEAQARFLRYYQPQIFDLSWNLYDRYLRASGVAGGVTSYSRFLQMMVGIPLDAQGLPVVIPSLSREHDAHQIAGNPPYTRTVRSMLR